MPRTSSLLVKRWTRFGHDRLYVSGSDGEQIGWIDLRTNQACPARPEYLSVLTDALHGWQAAAERDVDQRRPRSPEALVPVEVHSHAPTSPPQYAQPDAPTATVEPSG